MTISRSRLLMLCLEAPFFCHSNSCIKRHKKAATFQEKKYCRSI